MLRIKSALLALAFLASPAAQGQGLWAKEDFSRLCERLEPVSPETLAKTLGAYARVLKAHDGIEAPHLRAIGFEDMRAVLQAAAGKGWGILEMFTQPEFADPGGCALLLDGAALADIQRVFDLHGVWQIVARVAGQESARLWMSYMIVGRGRLIVGYPRKATVTMADGDAVTGAYEYVPYFSARIEAFPKVPGLTEIRALSSPDAEFEPFVGPYGIEIRALQRAGRGILVKYAWGIEQERHARAVPISLRDHVAISH